MICQYRSAALHVTLGASQPNRQGAHVNASDTFKELQELRRGRGLDAHDLHARVGPRIGLACGISETDVSARRSSSAESSPSRWRTGPGPGAARAVRRPLTPAPAGPVPARVSGGVVRCPDPRRRRQEANGDATYDAFALATAIGLRTARIRLTVGRRPSRCATR